MTAAVWRDSSRVLISAIGFAISLILEHAGYTIPVYRVTCCEDRSLLL